MKALEVEGAAQGDKSRTEGVRMEGTPHLGSHEGDFQKAMSQHIQACKDEWKKGLRSGLGNSRVTWGLLGKMEGSRLLPTSPPGQPASEIGQQEISNATEGQVDRLELSFPFCKWDSWDLLQVGLNGGGTLPEQRCRGKR